MLNAIVTQKISADFTNDLDVGSAEYPVRVTISTPLKNGTGADQANQIFTDTRTLAASTNEELDLSGGLTDAFGNTIAFTRIKSITVEASRDNTNNVEVTTPAANGVPLFLAASDGVGLTPGASMTMVFPDVDGIPVTAGTGDLLDFANSAGGTSVDYTVIIIGTI